MAAKGGVWTKKGFVKAADRKDAGGSVMAVADTDPATKFSSRINKPGIAENEAKKMLENYKTTNSDNDHILGLIEQGSGYPDSAIIVKGKDGTTEAIATISNKKNEIYVELLATHPKNMDFDNPNRVRGAGTQAVARAAKLAVDEGKDLTLESLPGANSFYEKLGFEYDREKTKYGWGGSLTPYKLSGSGLKNLADRAR